MSTVNSEKNNPIQEQHQCHDASWTATALKSMIQQHKAKTTIIYKSKPHQYHNTTSIQQIHSKTKATMCIPTFGRRINISIHDSDSSRPPLSFSRIVTVCHNRCGPPWHRLPPCIVEGQRVISRHRAAETQMKNRTFRRIE